MDMASDRLKRLEVLLTVIDAADSICKQLKQLPRTGKKRRNIFIKSYNRRPNNKRKRAAGYMGIMMTSIISAMQVKQILQQPIRKTI